MNEQTVQYTPLLQATLSDDEDDVHHFNSKEKNGSSWSPGKRHDALSVRSVNSAAPRHSLASSGNRRKKRRDLIVVVVVACVLIVGGAAALGFVLLSHKFNAGLVHDTQFLSRGSDWTNVYNESVSENSVTMVDVDGDGLDDVLFGLISTDMDTQIPAGLTVKQYCIKKGFQYPCIGKVMAVRGYDGKLLWKTGVRSSLIFVNCDNIDVNGDKKADCILSGRETTLQAVDLATGKIHWVIDAEDKTWSSHFVADWLVCRALSVPDIDGDGINDILISHGGNGSKAPEDHDRASGRIMFLSGASGVPLGRYLDLPNNRETYMSPVSYVTANATTYILLGSGGETVSGDLMITSYLDLYNYAMRNKPPLLRTIYSGKEKGVMISPVFVDITQDGTLDILMSAFDGAVSLYDGETLQRLWTWETFGFESYSTPAPGRFNDDNIPDFMMMWGHGSWPEYDYGMVYILNGMDGSVLWQGRSQMVTMYSGLTLRTKGAHDLFLTRTINLQIVNPHTSPTDHNPHQSKHKRHGGHHKTKEEDESMEQPVGNFQQFCDMARHDYEKEHVETCSSDLNKLKTEMILMDKGHSDSPQAFYTTFPHRHYYTEPVDESGQHCHSLSPLNNTLLDMCVVMKPNGITGAVGDVDGDGEVDLIFIEAISADLVGDTYDYKTIVGHVVLSRLSLASVLQGMTEVLPMKDQPWRQFMGTSGDNVYRSDQLKVMP